MSESAYLRSLRSINPHEVELFKQRRDSGSYRDIPPVQDLYERAIVAAWQAHQAGEVISAETISTRSGLTPFQAAELLVSPYFLQGLVERGIPYGEHPGQPTAEQLFAIQAMVDPSISTPVMARLKKLGIPFKRWQGWLRDPIFAEAYQTLRETVTKDMVDPTMTSLTMMAQTDVGAAKLLLEIAGVFTPGGAAAAQDRQLEVVVQRLQEAMQIFVRDPEVLRQIADYVRTGEAPMQELVALPLQDRPTG